LPRLSRGTARRDNLSSRDKEGAVNNFYVRLARWLILPVALAVGLVVALNSGSGVRAVSAQTITQAADVTGRVVGADLSGSVSVTTAGRTINLSLSGFESVARRAGVLTMRLNGIPGLSKSAVGFQMRFRYPVFYMRSPLFATVLPPGKDWVRFDIAQLLRQRGINPAVLSSAQSDPAQYLKYLRAVSGGVQKLGTEDVRGVPTTHYHAISDLNRYAATLPAAKRAATRQAFAKLVQLTGTSKIPVDVWVDGHHLIRRMRIDLSLAPSAHIPSHVDEVVTVDLFNFGPKPAVTAPPADQTEDLSALTARS
jgi:hypothetical protein